ncbi:hypothetical protein JCM11491_004169 [Sporobolomyces phaffii]
MKRLFNRKNSATESSTPEEGAVGQPPLAASTLPPAAPYSLPPPPRVHNVGQAIGWSVAMPAFDFPYLLALGDHLSSSSQASKDAAKALRTEFKHGAPMAQERAVRLTGILMRNTDHRFREQVASKKFLSDLADLATSKKTEPRVRDMVLRVLSPLAYEYQNDSDLRAITQTYNKLLSNPTATATTDGAGGFVVNGQPLDPDDELFTPTGLLPSSHTRTGRSRGERRDRGGGGVPKELEKVQMKELGERADKARGLARLLSEAIVFNGSDDSSLETNEMVQEFQTQCINEQSILGENMVWATVQAEKSRQELDAATASTRPDQVAEGGPEGATETPEQREMRRSRLSSNNPFADVVGTAGGRGAAAAEGADRKTEEETILEKILLAHSEIQDALSLLNARTSQARQDRQHAQDLETATQLSKTFVRGGDEVTEGPQGNYGEGGSKQRWESVEDRERAEHEAMLREQEELERYERDKAQTNQGTRAVELGAPTAEAKGYDHDESIYSNSNGFAQAPSTTTTASPYDGLGALESLKGLDFSTPSSPDPAPVQAQPRHSFPSSNPYANLSLSTSNTTAPAQDPFTESPVSSSFIPPQPSEKALGKLRRISTTGRTEDDSHERQQVLEDQLREKYRRNVEENGGIREV